MSISRRQFNRVALFGGAAVASSSYNFFFPKPAEAFSDIFSLRDLSSQKFFEKLQKYASAKERTGVLTAVLEGRPNRLDKTAPGAIPIIQEADKTLRSKNFIQSRTELAEAGNGGVSRLWARQKREDVGANVGSCFVQAYQGDFYSSKLAGPFTTAIHRALPILFHDARLKQPDIASILLPVRSLVDDNSGDDLSSWFGNDGTANTYWATELGKVRCEYKLKKQGAKGFGEVNITMEAEDHPTRNIAIKVTFDKFFS